MTERLEAEVLVVGAGRPERLARSHWQISAGMSSCTKRIAFPANMSAYALVPASSINLVF
jgi:hypothetical protein